MKTSPCCILPLREPKIPSHLPAPDPLFPPIRQDLTLSIFTNVVPPTFFKPAKTNQVARVLLCNEA